MAEEQSKFETDFNEIAEIIRMNCPKEFTRCHELAYIVNEGMRMRGHETVVKRGLYFQSFPLSYFYKGYVDHSWVKDKTGGLILDSFCVRPSFGGYEFWSQVQFEIVKNRRDKIRYVPWRIKQRPKKGVEDIPRKLFS